MTGSSNTAATARNTCRKTPSRSTWENEYRSVEIEAKANEESALPKVGDTVTLTVTKDAHGKDIWELATRQDLASNRTIITNVLACCAVFSAVVFGLSFRK